MRNLKVLMRIKSTKYLGNFIDSALYMKLLREFGKLSILQYANSSSSYFREQIADITDSLATPQTIYITVDRKYLVAVSSSNATANVYEVAANLRTRSSEVRKSAKDILSKHPEKTLQEQSNLLAKIAHCHYTTAKKHLLREAVEKDPLSVWGGRRKNVGGRPKKS